MSKKNIILEYCRGCPSQQYGPAELRKVRAELQSQMGAERPTSLAYIAAVLREAGYDVRFEDRYSEPVIPEPYASRLKDVLEFRDLASAEQSLRRIGEIFREYSNIGDRTGANFIRALVMKGRLRARSLATSHRVKMEKRQEKGEIASWFQVWLETPDLFAEWIELRKASQEFRNLFPNYQG